MYRAFARSRFNRVRFGALPAVLGLTLALLATLSACAPSDREFMSIGTGGTGGVYYPLGGGLARELSIRDSSRVYTAEVTGGSVENVNRILTGQVDLGFVLSVSASQGAQGPDGDRLRVVAPLYANLIHVLVREGAGIDGLADLRGAAVSVGSPGSGTEQTSRQILESVGLSYDDVDERFLSFTESASALRDGALDAAIISVGYPAAAVLEATTAGGIQILPLSAGERDGLSQRWSYYAPASIPAGVYPGVDEPLPTVEMMNWIVARDDLAPEAAAAVLDILAGADRPLARVHEMAGQVRGDALNSAPVPVHAGARTSGDG